MKQYIGISRDHSASMRGIARAAGRDYNETIQGLQEAAREHSLDTIVSVVRCGGTVQRETINSNVNVLSPISESSYNANGSSTPLVDSVFDLIELMEKVPDANDKDVSFLVMAITDGEENSSVRGGRGVAANWRALVKKMAELNKTDRWTFIFRVPRGGRRELESYGIHSGNILEWETTARGMEQATVATRAAFTNFYADRTTKGVTATRSFYKADLSNVDIAAVKAAMEDVSTKVMFMPVTDKDVLEIRPFVEGRLAGPMKNGAAFYQLTKLEEIQQQKLIGIRDKTTKAVYIGDGARDLLGLPKMQGTVKVKPDKLGNYDIFVQSTSVNRKLVPGTEVLYNAQLGKVFQPAR